MFHRISLLPSVLLFACLPFVCLGGSNFDQPKYTNYGGLGIPTYPVLPPKEIHPALWFKAAEIGALRARAEGDDYSHKLWRQVTQDPLLTDPLPSLPNRTNQQEVQKYYSTISRSAQVNALMSLLGDKGERARYHARAVEALNRAYDGPIYEMDPKTDSVEAIWRGTWAQNFAAAYDWVQPSLSKKEDELIRGRLAKEAQFISDTLYIWATHPHNHLSKPAWGLASLALALSDHPGAKAWLTTAIIAVNRNTRAFFSPDGIYREGPHYLLFSAINFIPFLYHYRNVSGVDDFPLFQPAFETIVATRNGKGWLPNLYDSYIRPFPTHMVAGAYRNSATWLNPDSKLGNVLQWSFRNTDFAAFDKSADQSGFNYTGDTWGFPLAVNEFLTYDPTIRPVAPSVSPTVFLKGGQTVFRNNWSYDDPATRYFLFHGVPMADNHFHFDHLSFIIQAENQMMASDSGYSRKNYGEPIRRKWYLKPEAHNVVTADGEAPTDAGVNTTPSSCDALNTPFFSFQEKEAPYPNKGAQKRGIAFLGGSYFVVVDQLTSPKPAEFQLNLHGGRGEMSSEGNRRVWTYSSDTYGPASKLAAWVLSDGATLADKKGEITYIKGDYAEFGYVTATQKARAATFMEILVPLSAAETVPKVTDFSGKTAVAATLEYSGATDTLVARRVAGVVKVGNLETDAQFAWVREIDRVQQWAVQEGRRLSYAGTSIFESSVPVTIAACETASGLEATVNAGDRAYILDLLPLGKGARVKSVSFNGATITAAYHEGRCSLTLKGSGQLKVELAR